LGPFGGRGPSLGATDQSVFPTLFGGTCELIKRDRLRRFVKMAAQWKGRTKPVDLDKVLLTQISRCALAF